MSLLIRRLILSGLCRASRFPITRFLFRARLSGLARTCLASKSGIEIGGPSEIFDRIIPIYPHVARLDNCVYSKSTFWEGDRDSGLTFRYDRGRRTGHNFITEGSELDCIRDQSYDFVLSSHNLEHIANPLKALHNWKRVLRPGGILLLVLPDKRRTFDYRRPVTTLDHLCEDYERGTGEDDTSHIEELITMWDYRKFPIAKSAEEHLARYSNNLVDRFVHHHVFDMQIATEMVNHAGFRILASETVWPNNLVLLAQSE